MPAARRLHVARVNGDPEAKAFFDGLYPADAICWLCDRPLGSDEPTIAILPDPAHAGMAILTPQCAACTALPIAERKRRELAMTRAIWPGIRWKVRKDTDPDYLRGRR